MQNIIASNGVLIYFIFYIISIQPGATPGSLTRTGVNSVNFIFHYILLSWWSFSLQHAFTYSTIPDGCDGVYCFMSLSIEWSVFTSTFFAVWINFPLFLFWNVGFVTVWLLNFRFLSRLAWRDGVYRNSHKLTVNDRYEIYVNNLRWDCECCVKLQPTCCQHIWRGKPNQQLGS